jgi:hypothetical protein
MFIFARFHARPGNESSVAEAILENMPPSRASEYSRVPADPGPAALLHPLALEGRGAFERTPACPIRCASSRVQPLIDHPLDVNRTEQIG